MATRRYKITPGEAQQDVVEEAGAAVNSDAIELTVDLATTYVTEPDGVTTRGVTRDEVIQAIEKFKAKIIEGSWPPA